MAPGSVFQPTKLQSALVGVPGTTGASPSTTSVSNAVVTVAPPACIEPPFVPTSQDTVRSGTVAEPMGGSGTPDSTGYAAPRESAASGIVAASALPRSAVHVDPPRGIAELPGREIKHAVTGRISEQVFRHELAQAVLLIDGAGVRVAAQKEADAVFAQERGELLAVVHIVARRRGIPAELREKVEMPRGEDGQTLFPRQAELRLGPAERVL